VRAREVGEAFPTEGDQLPRGRVRGRLQGDERLWSLAPPVVRYPDPGALQDGGVLAECLLHLNGRDVLAARDDDVLLAVAQLDIAVGMPDAEVAGVEPAAPEGLSGGVGLREVAQHHV